MKIEVIKLKKKLIKIVFRKIIYFLNDISFKQHN